MTGSLAWVRGPMHAVARPGHRIPGDIDLVQSKANYLVGADHV
jgi:hypothetical protein